MGSSTTTTTTTTTVVHLCTLTLFLSLFTSLAHDAPSFKSLSLENNVLEITPSPLVGYTSDGGSKDALSCERVHVSGISRLKLWSYSTSTRLTMSPSAAIPEKLHSKIQICSHRNSSLGLCRCEKDEWQTFHKGIWTSALSPYEDRYIDVKFIGGVSGHVAITADEDFQNWRLICLAIGFILLLAAPVVSSYVPFYYGSSMLIGVLLVVIILLFQGMKLLPTGRKSFLYLSLYGSVVGAGSYIIHYFSMLVNSVLVNFGLNEEMHNPVSIFLLVGITLAGAALGFYMVRKFVVSDDGSVDIGVAQFVKWAMRIVASTFILQGTPDTLLSFLTLVFGSVACSFITRVIRNWRASRILSPHPKRFRPATPARNRAEFFSKQGKMQPQAKSWNSPRKGNSWFGSPVRGLVSPPSISSGPGTRSTPVYPSSFHKVTNRKKMSRKEWEDFTKESTREAISGLAGSPQFSEWVINNAERIQIHPEDSSDEDEAVASASESSEETTELNGNQRGALKWY